ncbi:hypothetical protein VNO77_30806 [Canavalia gladiata]|uniref:Uncharacterized protein n=1 Tax=Canavalia gladiata TaxID=3824 RepID=A0AAN9KQI6_CANGL
MLAQTASYSRMFGEDGGEIQTKKGDTMRETCLNRKGTRRINLVPMKVLSFNIKDLGGEGEKMLICIIPSFRDGYFQFLHNGDGDGGAPNIWEKIHVDECRRNVNEQCLQMGGGDDKRGQDQKDTIHKLLVTNGEYNDKRQQGSLGTLMFKKLWQSATWGKSQQITYFFNETRPNSMEKTSRMNRDSSITSHHALGSLHLFSWPHSYPQPEKNNTNNMYVEYHDGDDVDAPNLDVSHGSGDDVAKELSFLGDPLDISNLCSYANHIVIALWDGEAAWMMARWLRISSYGLTLAGGM